MADSRVHDIVLFGATGFTGALTAEYLAEHAPADLRWAIAGRNRAKLEDLRGHLRDVNPACDALQILKADASDAASLRTVAEATRVVITTVGPYINYGEPLVAACAEAGTDYVDLTGEPEFVDLMWLRYHERAVRSGARIVHSCGFDSIPHDLGAYFTVQQLPEGVPISVEGFVRAGGTFSGGTYHSAVHGFSRARHMLRLAKERREREERPAGRKVRQLTGRPRNEPSVGMWVVPMPTIDPQVVCRSARALDRYGPDFSYAHYAQVKRLTTVAGAAVGVGGLFALSQLKPTRNLLLKLKSPGDGPTPEQRAKSWFRVRFVGEGGGQRVVTEVSGGDPGYSETARMLAESAVCLARDDLPETAGQVTPAVAMGNALIDRLQAGGIAFRVVDSGVGAAPERVA
jgi:short subunit dehydrogenase-like uncharacterized protein